MIVVSPVHAFVGDGCQGNLAGVVWLDNEIPDSELQKMATQFGAPETAFLSNSGNQYHIRWFTPETEVDLCGHATLASAYWLAKHKGVTGKIQFQSRSGELICFVNGEWIEMDFPEYPVEEAQPEMGLFAALGIHSAKFVGKSGDYFLVEVSQKELIALSPRFDEMRKLKSLGAFVTARSEDSRYDFVSRCFFPKEGIPEDPVTGSAHCSLGPYWGSKLGKTHLKAKQVSKSGGEIQIRIASPRIVLSGRAKE